ncbi:tetratricopeptide repeat protein [Anaerotignum sp. MB30-C6]|uniref:tetratricopeptide repeat protein n=1 Tax=Anaerotignum sp. MB30-C6 TaxID=3070814 RepID=UPI0027DC05BC|nr:tetratricopeptide repeat protein [Anaerotignum sp. MB30-C6]WMI82287.1 tetratricopeptide repeat protein [Anaerotignum sp. MB30-C6]
MRCPNCGFDFSEGYLCPTCGIDTFVFLKTRNLSIRLYNESLEMAKEMDLSGAAEKLEQSLLFDKSNIQARNLLGLIYCETGRIGDALKHWIISTSIMKENNPAVGYMDFLQKNGREMEKYNDAVVMYNQALLYLNHGSDDMAIIQLKKAIDSNPNFIDAYNLLTLCCLEENNHKRAQHFIDIVLKKDKKNPNALKYSSIIGGGSTSVIRKKAARSTEKKEDDKTVSIKRTDSAPPIPRYKRKEKKIGVLEKRDLISFLVGICTTAIVILVLIMPAINEGKDKTILELQTKVDNYAGETKMTPEEVLAMRTELETLQGENKQLRSEETKQANLELLQTAVSQMTDNDFEGCVATLDRIDTMGFSEEDISKYNSVKATAYPKAADNLYTKGKSDFLSNKFPEAKINLENALKYASNENFIDDAYFYLGKIAENDENADQAKTYYQKVITEYPDSNQLANAENALSQLAE